MASSVPTKHIPLHFYYMTVEKSQTSKPYDAQVVLADLCAVFAWLREKQLVDLKHEMPEKKKVMWLHDYIFQKTDQDTRINLVFKSAKYDHVRDVIDTESMEAKGRVKGRRDGDEEMTHFALRLGTGKDIYVAVFEYNSYGVTAVSDIAKYINESIKSYLEGSEIKSILKITFIPHLRDDFLKELENMKKKNLLSVVVAAESITGSQWMTDVAGRSEIKETATIIYGKKGRKTNIPNDIITLLYDEMFTGNEIKRIRVEGSANTGQLKIDTESMQLRHSLQVELTADTHEVKTEDCFEKIQKYLDSTGRV